MLKSSKKRNPKLIPVKKVVYDKRLGRSIERTYYINPDKNKKKEKLENDKQNKELKELDINIANKVKEYLVKRDTSIDPLGTLTIFKIPEPETAIMLYTINPIHNKLVPYLRQNSEQLLKTLKEEFGLNFETLDLDKLVKSVKDLHKKDRDTLINYSLLVISAFLKKLPELRKPNFDSKKDKLKLYRGLHITEIAKLFNLEKNEIIKIGYNNIQIDVKKIKQAIEKQGKIEYKDDTYYPYATTYSFDTALKFANKFILKINSDIKGYDITDFSFYPQESEVLIYPKEFKVEKIRRKTITQFYRDFDEIVERKETYYIIEVR